MRLTIPLPLGWRLHIPAKDLIIASAITLSILGIYFLRGALNQEFPRRPIVHRQLAKPHNIPIPVLAVTTAVAVPDVDGVDGGLKNSGSGGLAEITTIAGKGYRLPLTTERYVVEVRQVVNTKGKGDA